MKELVQATGLPKSTILHYLNQGLLSQPVKTSPNMAYYDPSCVQRVAMIKEMQVSPTTNEYIHIDFYEVSMDQEIVVKVPVEVTGKSEGIERGGLLQVVRRQLEVSCLPTDIPVKIEVDISALDIGDSIHVEEIGVGEKVKLLFDINFTVVTVVAPTVEKEPVSEEELEGVEEAEAEEAEGAEEAPVSEPAPE